MSEVKDIRWPKKEHLIKALEIFDDFRAACKLQLEMGNWMTIGFISKHHLNKILSTQYIDIDLKNSVYGVELTNRLIETVPLAKSYISFLRTDNVEKNKS